MLATLFHIIKYNEGLSYVMKYTLSVIASMLEVYQQNIKKRIIIYTEPESNKNKKHINFSTKWLHCAEKFEYQITYFKYVI